MKDRPSSKYSEVAISRCWGVSARQAFVKVFVKVFVKAFPVSYASPSPSGSISRSAASSQNSAIDGPPLARISL